MQIALAQLNTHAGKPSYNFEQMKKMIEDAKIQNADLIIFGEMCISGYLLQDKWLDLDWCEYIASFNEKVKDLSEGIGIIFGNLVLGPINGIEKGRDGRVLRSNCALFAQNKKWVKKENSEHRGTHIKYLNPDYRYFDDSRYFLSAIEIAILNKQQINYDLSPFLFEYQGKKIRIALEVCENLWSSEDALNLTEYYAKAKVDYIVNISASFWTLDKEKTRDKLVKQHAQNANNALPPLIYVTICGMQNTGKNILIFDGGSSVYNQKGECIQQCNEIFEQELKVVSMDEIKAISKIQDKLYHALIHAVKEVDSQIFDSSTKWIVGLSGGLDSSITAALLVKALGNKRVIAYNLSSSYNSEMTINNATMLAKALQIKLKRGSIEEVVEATKSTYKAMGYPTQNDPLVDENIQARIRGHLLSTFASIEKGVVINNGNKVEIALGYCTLYGDAIGAMALIGDCTKVQLFELAKIINQDFGQQVIPINLLPNLTTKGFQWELLPSAELKHKQVDPMKWFYHDWLISRLVEYPRGQAEEIMQEYLDGTLLKQPIASWMREYHLDQPKNFMDDLNWVLRTMNANAFKRIQMPPIVVVTKSAYGTNHREMQGMFEKTQRYKDLERVILEGELDNEKNRSRSA